MVGPRRRPLSLSVRLQDRNLLLRTYQVERGTALSGISCVGGHLMAMPKDAPDPDNAYAFMDYLLRPEVIAMAHSRPSSDRRRQQLIEQGVGDLRLFASRHVGPPLLP